MSTVTATAPGSAGPANGTHRITLTLQPEQLGEVRVTLVVKDGAVHVRLAGGEGIEGAAVHRALAGEAPELQRLLERTGAEARVTVRDPFAPLLPSTTPSPQAGPDTDARSGAQARQDRQDAQDGRTAREQPREQPRRQEPQRASYPIETTPVAGRLDRTV
ncbi:flagellar hook-length control protein FliK [Nocardioides aromaticivorans]|uniref:flagellar hook-length control protein FliK n=1 Tax=Nocardioides aromaticivorans TaxID=200618 RepID=UPI001A8D1D8E|nr:flagellar hook-length control protein FliK [Nocardioides aromaticivorans]